MPAQEDLPDVYGLDREKILREVQTKSAPADIDLSSELSPQLGIFPFEFFFVISKGSIIFWQRANFSRAEVSADVSQYTICCQQAFGFSKMLLILLDFEFN